MSPPRGIPSPSRYPSRALPGPTPTLLLMSIPLQICRSTLLPLPRLWSLRTRWTNEGVTLSLGYVPPLFTSTGCHPHCVIQNLYFYALACSPMDPVEAGRRKARLRYHQPPPPPPPSYAAPPNHVIHSASTSPNDSHLAVPRPTLPHFAPPRYTYYAPSIHAVQAHASPLLTPRESPVQSAPFANAGPPGVHLHSSAAYAYPTPKYMYRRSAC